MQDKIQEIMGLVEEMVGYDSRVARHMCLVEIQSKLRELVEQNTLQQPLSYERILSLDCIYMDTDPDGESLEIPKSCIVRFARNIELAHGITKGI